MSKTKKMESLQSPLPRARIHQTGGVRGSLEARQLARRPNHRLQSRNKHLQSTILNMLLHNTALITPLQKHTFSTLKVLLAHRVITCMSVGHPHHHRTT